MPIKEVKNIKFQSIQIKTNQLPKINPNKTFKIHFCIYIMLCTKYNWRFNVINQTAVYNKRQQWSENCINKYEEATILEIILINARGEEE
jgi:hypothetical protein